MQTILEISSVSRDDQIAPLCQETRRAACRVVSEDVAARLELALAEALNNVVKHACAGTPDIPMGVVLSVVDPDGLELVVWDHGGKAFVPPASAMPDFDPDDIDALPEGGFGLAIITQCATSVRHEWRDGTNRIIMTFQESRP